MNLVNKTALFFLGVLFIRNVPAHALEEVDAQAHAVEQVEKLEHVKGETRLVAPTFLMKEDPTAGQLIAVTGSLGSTTRHGIRYTWCFQTQNEKTKVIFQKLPFEATEWASGDAVAVKGMYWVYNCFLCDTPESGFIYKVPVIAKKQGHDFVMKADTDAPNYETVRTEAQHQLQEVLKRYTNPLPEIKKMRREINALFVSKEQQRR